MITLNLVSQELKKEIKLRHVYSSLKKIGLIITLLVLVMSVMFQVARYIIQKSFIEITEQTTLVTSNSSIYTGRVKNINAKIDLVDAIQKEYIVWSEFIKIIANNIPENITLSYFKINKNDSTLSLKGIAATREEFVALKDNLSKLEFLAAIDFPIQNMLEKENVAFEIKTNFNLKKINLAP
jgi:Tfp pilus assembly protein PilN